LEDRVTFLFWIDRRFLGVLDPMVARELAGAEAEDEGNGVGEEKGGTFKEGIGIEVSEESEDGVALGGDVGTEHDAKEENDGDAREEPEKEENATDQLDTPDHASDEGGYSEGVKIGRDIF
jgi:hypothetical protein